MANIARGKQVSNGHGHHSRGMHYQLNGYIDHAGIFYRALLKELSDPDSELWMKKADLLKAQFIEKYNTAAFVDFFDAHTEESYKEFAVSLKSFLEAGHSAG